MVLSGHLMYVVNCWVLVSLQRGKGKGWRRWRVREMIRQTHCRQIQTAGRKSWVQKKRIHISAIGASCYWSIIYTANAFCTSNSGSQWEQICVCVCVWGERRMCFWQFSWLRCWQWGGGRKFWKKKAENWARDKMIYGRSERRDKWQAKYQKIARRGAEEK